MPFQFPLCSKQSFKFNLIVSGPSKFPAKDLRETGRPLLLTLQRRPGQASNPLSWTPQANFAPLPSDVAVAPGFET